GVDFVRAQIRNPLADRFSLIHPLARTQSEERRNGDGSQQNNQSDGSASFHFSPPCAAASVPIFPKVLISFIRLLRPSRPIPGSCVCISLMVAGTGYLAEGAILLKALRAAERTLLSSC